MARIQWELFWRILTECPGCCDEVECSVNGQYTIFGYLPEIWQHGKPVVVLHNDHPYWVGYCDYPDGADFSTAEEFVNAPLYGGKSIREIWPQFEIEGWLCGDCRDWLEHSDIQGILYDAERNLFYLAERTE